MRLAFPFEPFSEGLQGGMKQTLRRSFLCRKDLSVPRLSRNSHPLSQVSGRRVRKMLSEARSRAFRALKQPPGDLADDLQAGHPLRQDKEADRGFSVPPGTVSISRCPYPVRLSAPSGRSSMDRPPAFAQAIRGGLLLRFPADLAEGSRFMDIPGSQESIA